MWQSWNINININMKLICFYIHWIENAPNRDSNDKVEEDKFCLFIYFLKDCLVWYTRKKRLKKVRSSRKERNQVRWWRWMDNKIGREWMYQLWKKYIYTHGDWMEQLVRPQMLERITTNSPTKIRPIKSN